MEYYDELNRDKPKQKPKFSKHKMFSPGKYIKQKIPN